MAAWVPRLIAAYRRLRGATGGDPLALSTEERRDVGRGIERLLGGLTRERALAGVRYFDDAQLLGAYLLFYWPVSYAQAAAVLGELDAPVGSVLDLGSGPGPLALAALDAGAASALALDRVPQALALARGLAQGGNHALATEPWDESRALPGRRFDTILAGHVLNELYAGDREKRAALVEELLARLQPGGRVIVIEPALRETSRALLEVRDLLVQRGVVVRAPCLYRGACPALAREGDWCHAERAFQPPSLLAELADAARLHRDALKMTYLVLEPRGAWPQLPEGRLFRIVSEPLDRKGQHRLVGCGPEGRVPLVLPEKHVRDGNAAFVGLQRGDVVRVEGLEPRGDGLRLGSDSTLERVAPAGAPLGRAR